MELKDRLKQARKHAGLTQMELADRARLHQTSVSDIETGKSQSSTHLLTLATICGVSPTWLAAGVGAMLAVDAAFQGVKEKSAAYYSHNSEVTISQYNTGGRGGPGLVLRDQPGVIRQWTVDRDWLRANVPSHSAPENLAIVTGFGDSMPDVFSPGDPVLIDTGVTECKHDGVYFFRVGNEGFIKRLQIIPQTGIRVISQNPEYERWTITPDMDFAVLGKVLRAWPGKNY